MCPAEQWAKHWTEQNARRLKREQQAIALFDEALTLLNIASASVTAPECWRVLQRIREFQQRVKP